MTDGRLSDRICALIVPLVTARPIGRTCCWTVTTIVYVTFDCGILYFMCRLLIHSRFGIECLAHKGLLAWKGAGILKFPQPCSIA